MDNFTRIRHAALKARIEANLIATSLLIAKLLDEGEDPEPFLATLAGLEAALNAYPDLPR